MVPVHSFHLRPFSSTEVTGRARPSIPAIATVAFDCANRFGLVFAIQIQAREGLMADCLDGLREIAATGQDDPRVAAGQIMREFKASAGGVECEAITRRLEDTLLAGRHTAPPMPQFDLHTRWLATLEGAVAAIKES